jgi:PAS domain S-box-containing protein
MSTSPRPQSVDSARLSEANDRIVATIQRVGTALMEARDLRKIVQAVTDAGTELSGAQFGAFFYNVVDDAGEAYTLYTLSGVPREAFAQFPMPRNTLVFGPTFHGEGVIRLDDVTRDPRYGKNAPYSGMPPGHLPVRSYLAVPVVSRTGDVIGGLFFGHATPGVFSESAERIVVGIAAQAAIAVDNARLYEAERRARAAAETADARYRSLFAEIRDAILVTGEEARYIDANPAATDLLGYTHDEFLRMTVPDVVAGDAEWARTLYEHFTRERYWRGEIDLRRKDGSLVETEVTAVPVDLPTGTIYVAVIRDISERRAHERMRNEFLAMVAHEIRTPLTSLTGYAQLMQRRQTYNARIVATLVAQANSLTRIVNEVLEMTRIDAGKLELNRTRTDLVDLARVIAASAQLLAPRHTVRVEAPDDRVEGNWDAARIGQVLQNLIENAITYVPVGGDVIVRVARGEREASVAVIDRGVGIAPEDLPHLFERFYRAPGSIGHGIQGFGIGLAICKELVAAHGGNISASSSPGEGSIFTVTLPYGEGTSPAPASSRPASGQGPTSP